MDLSLTRWQTAEDQAREDAKRTVRLAQRASIRAEAALLARYAAQLVPGRAAA
jgi:hypothetical protein